MGYFQVNPFAPLIKYALAALAAVGAVFAVMLGLKAQKAKGVEQGKSEVVAAVKLAKTEKELEIVVKKQEIENAVDKVIENPVSAEPNNVVERVRSVYGNRRSKGK